MALAHTSVVIDRFLVRELRWYFFPLAGKPPIQFIQNYIGEQGGYNAALRRSDLRESNSCHLRF